MDPTDIRYILDDLACNASQEALQELYMLYYKRIARYIGLYVRYDGAVMELTSDVFFAVWENRLELPEIRNFNAYIYRIAKFKALNYLRKRNLPTVNLDEMPLDLFARTSTTPEDDCISAETVREINRAIESLPPKCREVFKLSYLEDLSNREISERLGISQSTKRPRRSISPSKPLKCTWAMLCRRSARLCARKIFADPLRTFRRFRYLIHKT